MHDILVASALWRHVKSFIYKNTQPTEKLCIYIIYIYIIYIYIYIYIERNKLRKKFVNAFVCKKIEHYLCYTGGQIEVT